MRQIFLGLALGVLLAPNLVSAYDTGTHEYLTAEIISSYNRNFPDKPLPVSWKMYLLDGSRREDDQFRALNHFYDPVHDIGFHDAALGTWNKSPDWASGENLQNQSKYKIAAGMASILSAAEKQQLNLISTETDFAWGRGIRAYARGDEALAAFILGHTLHLIEDLSVPEHTRNDAHPGDSPYEKWTAQFTLANRDGNLNLSLAPKIFPDLNSYFYELAKYSNNNFYSKDTIGIDQFNEPQLAYVSKDGKYFYAFKVDNSGDYHLAIYKRFGGSVLFSNSKDIDIETDDSKVVLRDYWSHLAPKAIQYGAGVVRLFIEEGEKAKNNPNFVREDPKSLLGEILDASRNVVVSAVENIRGLFAGPGKLADSGVSSVPVVQEVKPADISITEPQPAIASAPSAPPVSIEQDSLPAPTETPTPAVFSPEVPSPETVQTASPESAAPTHIFVAVGGPPPAPVISNPPADTSAPPEASSTDFSGAIEATSTEAMATSTEPAATSTPPAATSTEPAATSTPIQIFSFTATTTSSSTLRLEWSLSAMATSTLFELNPPAENQLYSGTSTQFDYSIPGIRSFDETRNFLLRASDDIGAEASATTTIVLPANGTAPPPPPPPGPSEPSGVIENLTWYLSTSTRELVVSGRVWSNNPLNTSRMEIEFLPLASGFMGVANHAGDSGPTGSTSTVAFSVPEGQYHFQARVADSTGTITPWLGENAVAVLFPPVPANLTGTFTQSDFPNGYCGFGKVSVVPSADIPIYSVEFYAACVNGDCLPPNTFRIFAADGTTLLAESDGAAASFGYPDTSLTFQNFTGTNQTTLKAGETYYATPYSSRGQCTVNPFDAEKNKFWLR